MEFCRRFQGELISIQRQTQAIGPSASGLGNARLAFQAKNLHTEQVINLNTGEVINSNTGQGLRFRGQPSQNTQTLEVQKFR